MNADLTHSLGTRYAEMHNYGEALPFFETAHKHYSLLLGPMHRDSINVCTLKLKTSFVDVVLF